MSRYMNKICLLLALLILASIVFTGCGNADEKSTDPDEKTTLPASDESESDPEEAEEPVEEELEPVTLKYVFLSYQPKPEEADEVWAEFNNKLSEKLPNTTVEFQLISNVDYAEKWKMMAAAGEAIDLAWTGWLIPYGPEVEKGSYMELDDLLEKYGQDIIAELPKWVIDCQRWNGKLYSIRNLQFFQSTTSLKTPKELGDKYFDWEKVNASFDKTPTTTQENYDVIEEYLATLKENDVLEKGISFTTFNQFPALRGYMSFPDVSYLFGRKLGDGKIVFLPETPEQKLSYQVANDWYKKGYIRSDILSVQNPRDQDGKVGGQTVWFHNDAKLEPFTTPADPNSGMVEYTTYPLVSLDKYKAPPTISPDATATAIPRTSQNPERAMMLLNLLHTSKGQDLYNMLVFGVEGKQYDLTSDGKVELNKDSSYFNTMPKWVMGNTFNTLTLSTETPLDIKTTENDWKTVKEINAVPGFAIDTSEFSTELAQMQAIQKEFDPALVTGAVPDWQDSYEKYIAKMKTAGADEVLEQIQIQFDKYLEENNLEP